jgi:hypothetical protein
MDAKLDEPEETEKPECNKERLRATSNTDDKTYTRSGSFATVRKSQKECSSERTAYDKLKDLPEYGAANVDEKARTVTTRFAAKFKMMKEEDLFAVFSALRELHRRKVIHGDLKESHIRWDNVAGKVFFIDLGCSVSAPLEGLKGFTAMFTSFDALVRRNVHPLDDYEAVLITALDMLKRLHPKDSILSWMLPHDPQPAPPAVASRKRWLRWKLELMNNVYTARTTMPHVMPPFLRVLVDKLLLVWAMPRTGALISDEHLTMLCDAQDHAIDFIVALRAQLLLDYTASLCRATRAEKDDAQVRFHFMISSSLSPSVCCALSNTTPLVFAGRALVAGIGSRSCGRPKRPSPRLGCGRVAAAALIAGSFQVSYTRTCKCTRGVPGRAFLLARRQEFDAD